MKKIMLSAGSLLLSLLVIVDQNSAQSFDQQKPVENKVKLNQAGGPNVVKSLNDLTGDVTLQAGANITVTPNGKSLIVAAPNALSSVVTDASLTGNGTQGNPLRVAPAVDSAMRFSESVTFTISANTSVGGATLMTVPAGKKLIVEYASGQCVVPSGQFISKFELEIISSTLPKRSKLIVVPTAVGSDPALGNIYAASSPVKFYVDAGYDVQVFAWRGTVASGEVGCSFNYSGSLINQP